MTYRRGRKMQGGERRVEGRRWDELEKQHYLTPTNATSLYS